MIGYDGVHTFKLSTFIGFSLLTLASKLGSLKDIPLPIPPLWLEESQLAVDRGKDNVLGDAFEDWQCFLEVTACVPYT